MLKRVEEILAARSPDPAAFRLAHYFDLIGGTSTGSIIACLLALGRSMDEVIRLYRKLCPQVFSSAMPRIVGIQSKFSPKKLEEVLKKELGDMRLDAPELQTGFALIAKRIDTGSPWFLYNNERSPYWEENRQLLLRKIVQASSSAPFFLDAVEMPLKGDRDQVGIFFDGGVSPHNNPSAQLLLAATMPQYGFDWDTGPDQLFVLSCGTGSARPRISVKDFKGKAFAADKAVHALRTMIYDNEQWNITLLQALSEPRRAWRINSEIGGLEGGVLGGRELLSYRRYNVSLDRNDEQNIDDLKRILGVEISKRKWNALLRLDNGSKGNLDLLVRVGAAAGERLFFEDDLPAVFDLPR
jgi:uncharacterized protein